MELYVGLFAEDSRPDSILAQLMGRMVGVDAFSQALTNPLLAHRVYQVKTFSELGMKIIERDKDPRRLGPAQHRESSARVLYAQELGAFASMSATPAKVEYCDVVMKGGVTSGIVYPPALSELAKRFAFRNIGGTSIGAVAAALAAAAELGRRKQIEGTFARLSAIPEELSESGAIVRLMAPDTAAKSVFASLSAALFEGREMRPAILKGVWRAILHYGFNAVIIALAVPLLALVIRATGGASGWGLWLFVVPLTLAVFAAVVASRTAWTFSGSFGTTGSVSSRRTASRRMATSDSSTGSGGSFRN